MISLSPTYPPHLPETAPGKAVAPPSRPGEVDFFPPAVIHRSHQLGNGDRVTIGQKSKSIAEFHPYGPDNHGTLATTRNAPATENTAPSGEETVSVPGSTKQGITAEKSSTGQNTAAPAGNNVEDPAVKQEIARLKATEEKVKAHEAAHKASGGAMTGPISYSYTRGPDGRSYITGGEVPISISSGKTPQETISRMQQVIRAALAPSDPSPQDRAVAAQASAQLQEAQLQAIRQQTEGLKDEAASTADGSTGISAAAANNHTAASTNESTLTPIPQRKNETSTQELGRSIGSQPIISAFDPQAAIARQAYSDPAVTGADINQRRFIAAAA